VDEHIKCVHVLRAVLRKVVTPRSQELIGISRADIYLLTKRHAICEQEDMMLYLNMKT
jgi:hypothetical protein